MTKSLTIAAMTTGMLLLTLCGCADKQLMINGMICPEGHSEARAKADFTACRYYDLNDADKASAPAISVECKECLEKKGYKILK